MINFIRISESNPEGHYFMSSDFINDYNDSKRSYKYNPEDQSQFLFVNMHDSSLRIPHDQIKREYAGSLYFEYKNDKYIVLDDYQDIMISSGYIVKNNYNKEMIEVNLGANLFKDYFHYIFEILDKIYDVDDLSFFNVDKENETISVTFSKGGYDISCNIDSIHSIVGKNHQRKINSLPYYPFLKNMDKFGTVYMSIFAKKVEDDSMTTKDLKATIEDFIKTFIDTLNDYASQGDSYHFEEVKNNKIIHRSENI